jgi:hypothetical protein
MSVDATVLDGTRHVVHGIAEQLLAAQEWKSAHTIRLYVRDGALSTADLPGPISRIELRGGSLVRHPEGLVVPVRGPLGDLAERLGIEFGLRDGPYPLASHCGPQDEARLEPVAMALIEDAWRLGDRALRQFSGLQPVVWPEHLDIAVTVDEVNYGVSPGDSYLPEPYAYVGPHAPRDGDFWNAPFGAARKLDDLDGDDVPDLAAVVVDFFEQGRTLTAG